MGYEKKPQISDQIYMSIMKRNEFVDYCKKNAFESGDGFIFKPEWLNIIKDKDDDYKAWSI